MAKEPEKTEALPAVKAFCSNCGTGQIFNEGEAQFDCENCGALITRDNAILSSAVAHEVQTRYEISRLSL